MIFPGNDVGAPDEDVGKVVGNLPAADEGVALNLEGDEGGQADHQRGGGSCGAPDAGAELLAKELDGEREANSENWGEDAFDGPDEHWGEQEKT